MVNVRDPRETIPSLLKLLQGGWKALGWDPERQRRCLEVMVETSFESYRHPFEALEASPATRGAIVDYRELTSDPAAANTVVRDHTGRSAFYGHQRWRPARGA